MLIHASVRLVLIVVREMRVTKATITLIISSEVFLRSSSLLLAAMAFNPIRSEEFLPTVLADVASVAGVETHVEGH